MRFNKTSRSYNDQLKSMLNESEAVEPDYSGFANFSETVSVSSASIGNLTSAKPKKKKAFKVASSPSPASNPIMEKTNLNLSKSSLPQSKPKIIRKVVPTAYGLRTIEVSAAEDAREYQQTISRTSSMTSSIRTPLKNHKLRKHSSFTSTSPSPKARGYPNYQHHDFKSFDDLVLEEDSSTSTLKPPSALLQRSANQTSTPQKNRHKRVSFNETSASPGINSIINNLIIEEDDDALAVNSELTPPENNYNYPSPLKFKNNNNSTSSLKLKRNTISGPISSNSLARAASSKNDQRVQTKSIVHRADSTQENIRSSEQVIKQHDIPVITTSDQVQEPEKQNGAAEQVLSAEQQVEPISISTNEIDDQMIQLSSEPLEPPTEIPDQLSKDREEIKVETAAPSRFAAENSTALNSTVSSVTTSSKLADAPKIDLPAKVLGVSKTNSISRKPSQRQPEKNSMPSVSKSSSISSAKANKGNLTNASKLSKRHSMIERINTQQHNTSNIPLGAAAASASIKKSYATKSNNNIPPKNKIRPVSMLSAPVSSLSTPKKDVNLHLQIKPKPLFNGTNIQRSVSTSRSFRNNMGTLESPAPLHTKSSFEKLRSSNAFNGNTTNNNTAFKRHSMRDSSGGLNSSAVAISASSNVNGSGYTSPILMMKSRFADSDSEDEAFGSSVPGRIGGFNILSLRESSNNPTASGLAPISSNPESHHSMFGFSKIHHNSQNHVASITEEPEALKTPSTINSDKLFEKHLSELKKGFFKSQLDNSYSNYHKEKKEAKLKKSMAHNGIDSMLLSNNNNNEEIVDNISKKGRFSKFKKIFGKR